MKVRIRLFGTLRDLTPDHSPETGLEMDLPQGTTFGDMVRCLGIPESAGALSIVEGRVVKPTETIGDVDEIRILQPLEGG